jgi:TonB family protein
MPKASRPRHARSLCAAFAATGLGLATLAQPTPPSPPSPPAPLASEPQTSGTVRMHDTRLGRCVSRPPPYPVAALRHGWAGTTVLAFAVGEDGLPVEPAVARSSGHELLDVAALQHLKRCIAASHALTPHEVLPVGRFRVPIAFRLED